MGSVGPPISPNRRLLADCGKTMLALLKSHGPHVWDKPGLSGYLVCLVHLVSLMQPNKPDRPNRPNEQDKLADFFSILLEATGGLLKFSRNRLSQHRRQNLVVPKPEFLSERFTDQHILHMLMVRCTERRLAFLQPIELMAFERLD